MVETIRLAHMPPHLPIYATLYPDVSNTTFLKEQLLAGNADFEYAFIDAATVVSRKHALSAAFRAMNDYVHDRLKSRNIHSEIVFALSPNNNIGDAFRRFGIGDTTKHLIVLKVATTPDITAESVEKHLNDNIQGQAVAFDDEQLQRLCDVARVRKIYKLSANAGSKRMTNGDTKASVDDLEDLETQVLGLMALRGAT